MSRRFTELYIDEDVSALLMKLLRSRGFVVISAQEAGMLGCNDEEQLAHAARQRKTLLTHNRVHFEVLVQQYYATGRTHSGVIIAVRRSPYEISSLHRSRGMSLRLIRGTKVGVRALAKGCGLASTL